MTDLNDPKILEFRMQRLRNSPRNWTYWVAGFTAANGIFLALQHDLMILAGFVLAFAVPGSTSHLVLAAALIAAAFASSKHPRILIIPLVAYLADLLFAAYAGIWSAFGMHLVVLTFIGLSLFGLRSLKNLQAKQVKSGG